jgi:hypothetical protein
VVDENIIFDKSIPIGGLIILLECQECFFGRISCMVQLYIIDTKSVIKLSPEHFYLKNPFFECKLMLKHKKK